MAVILDNLDERTRRFMLDELERDVAENTVYVSPRLSATGRADYVGLLREAIERGDDDTLAAGLRARGRLNETEQAAKPSGGYTTKRMAVNAAEMMADGEFNRYYCRGICRRAIEDRISSVEVYRAKTVGEPRPRSQALIGRRFPAEALLDDLRSNPGRETQYGVPGGPGSGISVRLPRLGS